LIILHILNRLLKITILERPKWFIN
jgi:hypothetical protein